MAEHQESTSTSSVAKARQAIRTDFWTFSRLERAVGAAFGDEDFITNVSEWQPDKKTAPPEKNRENIQKIKEAVTKPTGLRQI